LSRGGYDGGDLGSPHIDGSYYFFCHLPPPS
jgi:hypothetical protein